MQNMTWLVLTSANAAQARGYRAQLEVRERRQQFDPTLRWRVIPDPGRRRIGSGGSILWALYQLAVLFARRQSRASSFRDLFQDERILLIHSGGDARQFCPYAAQGKVLTPLPIDGRDGHPATLLDLIFAELADLTCLRRGHVLIATGDVMFRFPPAQVSFDHPGAVGLACPATVEQDIHHGVYVTNTDGSVHEFLQKADAETLRDRFRSDATGRVLLDTGVVSLDALTIQRWLAAAGVQFRNGQVRIGRGLLQALTTGQMSSIDLYRECLMALSPSVNETHYLKNSRWQHGRAKGQRSERSLLSSWYRSVHGTPFHVNILPYCGFYHLGSGRELLANVRTLTHTPEVTGFNNLHRTVIPHGATLKNGLIYNCILGCDTVIQGGPSLIEGVHTTTRLRLAGNNLLVGLPRHARVDVSLPIGWCLTCLPVNDQDWAAVVFGIEDDFRITASNGATLGRESIHTFLRNRGLLASHLWKGQAQDQHTLWHARLWRVGKINDVLKQAIWMCGHDHVNETTKRRWIRGHRMSMREIMRRLDHDRLLAQRNEIYRITELYQLPQTLLSRADRPAAQVLELIKDRHEADIAMRLIARSMAKHDDDLYRARCHELSQIILRRFPGKRKAPVRPPQTDHRAAAFDAVARAVTRQVDVPDAPTPASILHDQVVWATCPVRIDLAGGWSDTPPICIERGGDVVNAAVMLNAQYPVQVMAKLTERHSIRISSIDLGEQVELRKSADVLDYRKPTDWTAIPKAALVIEGICPNDAGHSLKRWLDKLGGGLDVTVFSAVPKGSGLGTSSIMGASMLACLARVVDRQQTWRELVARTSLLEQLMTTGGGWQDQVGGTMSGVKLIQTEPGLEQTPRLHWTGFDLSKSAEFRECSLLYYTGYQRLAKGILQNVVARYLARDPQLLSAIVRLKTGATKMKADLDQGDLAGFSHGLNEYWDLKKLVDPGVTNDKLERLITRIRQYVRGLVIPGAGGGGLLFMIARDADAALRIRRTLEQNPPHRLARFFNFEFSHHGLEVTTL